MLSKSFGGFNEILHDLKSLNFFAHFKLSDYSFVQSVQRGEDNSSVLFTVNAAATYLPGISFVPEMGGILLHAIL